MSIWAIIDIAIVAVVVICGTVLHFLAKAHEKEVRAKLFEAD